MPYKLLHLSEEYIAGCPDYPVSWYGTKHLKYIDIEGYCSGGNLGSYQESAFFQAECTQQFSSPFSAPCSFVLGTTSSTCPSVVSVLEGFLMLELSFLESYYSGRKALWSSCGDMLTRGWKWQDENFELMHGRKALKLTPNTQLWFQNWKPVQNCTFPPTLPL